MKHIIPRIQRYTGTTRGEAFIVLLMVIGLISGRLILWFDTGSYFGVSTITLAKIDRLIDSLAISDNAPESDTSINRSNEPSALLSSTRISEDNRSPGTRKGSVRMNINKASKSLLQTLPGVGAATAEKIIQRRMLSPFNRPEDIMEVPGIGIKKFEKMREYLTTE